MRLSIIFNNQEKSIFLHAEDSCTGKASRNNLRERQKHMHSMGVSSKFMHESWLQH